MWPSKQVGVNHSVTSSFSLAVPFSPVFSVHVWKDEGSDDEKGHFRVCVHDNEIMRYCTRDGF